MEKRLLLANMAFSNLFVEILVRVIITTVFVLINAIIIREIIVFFKGSDDTLLTSTAISFWIGLTFLIAGVLSDIKIFGWIVAAVMNIFFIYLYKRYYAVEWKESILMWETWISIMVYMAILIAAFRENVITLLWWGLIPLGINLSFVTILKLNMYKRWVNISTSLLGYLGMNVIWILLFKIYLPL